MSDLTKQNIVYSQLKGQSSGYMVLLGIIAALITFGLASAYYMEHNGHWVTGMTNQIVWGVPHVFAVFLIVAASGALNIASIGTVFGKPAYQPLGRLSSFLAIALLAGGLMVLVLDLGRPDRLIVAMTKYNFKSIFAWNIYLYSGFFVVVGVYIWTQMDFNVRHYYKKMGIFAFIWRLALTTGTGSIFGFLVARQGFDAAIMAPMFIIMSFSFGLAIFLLVLMYGYQWSERQLGDAIVMRLKNLLGVFVAAVLMFVVIKHLANLYATEHHGVEKFILLEGGIYTFLFWVVQIGAGSIAPLIILFSSLSKSRMMIAVASMLVIVGGLAQIYVIIIGGQAYPLQLFPGSEVSSSFYDGVVNSYAPTLPEILLGLGGVGVAMAVVTLASRVFEVLPASLADEVTDPHHAASLDKS